MKRTILVLACFVFTATYVQAQKVDRSAALKEAVETERAFSKMSELKGTRDSFLAFVADDGILFRPTAVNGKKWLLDHPTPPSTSGKRPWLSWQPIFGDIAASGDLAYTTGPWQFRQDIKDEKAVAFGDFITVWKKQSDGSWKFAIDLGISHPEPPRPMPAWEPVVSKSTPTIKSAASGASERQELWDADLRFARASEMNGADKALKEFAAEQIRLYREHQQPFIGREIAAGGLPRSSVWTWKPAFSDVSRANDLGYTYGSYEVKDSSNKLTDKGNYLRIWKRQGRAWKVVVDVANPIPIEEKKS